MESPGPLNKEDDAALVRFVNGISAADYAVVSVGTTVQNGKIYYRNSLVTSIQLGSVPVSVGAINQSVVTQKDKRTLLVYAIKNGEGEKLIEITSDPLRQIPNISDRRVINATADIDFVSASYDTNFRINKPSEIVADRVPFGESSAVYTLERDRRGTMYFYDAVSEKDIYSLPIDFGPLGNSYSLVVTGRKEDGYEVIVLQEF